MTDGIGELELEAFEPRRTLRLKFLPGMLNGKNEEIAKPLVRNG